MAQPTIAMIIGTIREDRFGHKPARWILEQARAHAQAEYEIVDLRDYPLPFYSDAKSPMFGPSENAVAQRWLKKMASFDGYVFITAEYNYGISGALKNALDYAYHEFYRKPAAFVAYGEVGGAAGLMHHTDQGVTYSADESRRLLDRFGMIASMSRKGDCWDNAVAESFFGQLKNEA